jgi:hypothetical protein
MLKSKMQRAPLFRLTTVSGFDDALNEGAVDLADVLSGDWDFAIIVCFKFDLQFMVEQCPRLQEVDGKGLLVTSALDSLFPAGAHKLLQNPQVQKFAHAVLNCSVACHDLQIVACCSNFCLIKVQRFLKR